MPNLIFLNKMIPILKSAVVMSKEALAFGNKNELKQMAKKIMSHQNKEIEQFQTMLIKIKS